MGAKLHELIAVEPNLRGQGEATRLELKGTFGSKPGHFTKMVKHYQPVVEGGLPEEAEEHPFVTKVYEELDWIREKVAAAIDCGHRIDIANTVARADIILDDGTVIQTGVPTTSLLRMEHRIEEITELLKAIKTLDPAKGFKPDPTEGDGIYVAREVKKPRTEKVQEFKVMVQATEKFPAQVKEYTMDRVVGYTTTQEWSSLITVAEKGRMLDRMETLARAVKSARSRANDVDVDTKANAIGDVLLKYVFNGIKP